jgi:tetraacyldisaccharide 4'-kinase
LTAAFPLLILYFARRIWRDPRYFRHIRERLGWLDRAKFGTKPSGIWLHAVSAGEVLSAIPLLRELRQRLPQTGLFVSVTTLTGRDLAERRLAGLADGVFYAPLDYAWAVRAALRQLQPCLFINLETELWPNRFRELQRSGCRIAQVNGRISDKAWPTYRRLGWFWKSVVGHIDWLSVQGVEDQKRFQKLGYRGPSVDLGNLKFDFEPPANAIAPELLPWLRAAGAAPLWIAASTVGATGPDDIDEEDAILDAFQELNGKVRLLLAPRRPERFELVAQKLTSRNLSFIRRTQLRNDSWVPVLLLDSLGELAPLFEYAAVVFVGGSLCRWGGHNILEPAYFGKPILVGPHMQNFADIYKRFQAANAVITVSNSNNLTAALTQQLSGPCPQASNAAQLAASLRGVSSRTTRHLLPLLDLGINCPQLPLAGLTSPLRTIWIAASNIPREPQRLPVPVISIGNLSMGGTGKTPVTLALASALASRGYRVGILTRGYKRKHTADLVLLPGDRATWESTGDEAQEYLAVGQYAIGISRNRYKAGTRLLERYPADFLLLDDGFQHKKLHRDFDIALIDCSQPFPGGDVPPAGLLREPIEALQRADAIFLTRAERSRKYTGIRALLPASCPAYELSYQYSLSANLPAGKGAAFCGLGNPAGFRQALQHLGLSDLDLFLFPDHHEYLKVEQDKLLQRYDFLVTTQKDAVKLHEKAKVIIVNLEVLLPEQLISAALEKSFLAPQSTE